MPVLMISRIGLAKCGGETSMQKLWAWLLRKLGGGRLATRPGEVRIAPPHAMRGRLYAKRGADEDGVKARTEPETTISARIYRVATRQWENLGVISKGAVSKPKE